MDTSHLTSRIETGTSPLCPTVSNRQGALIQQSKHTSMINKSLRVILLRSILLLSGVAHNKILAKLASGMHKPAQQTVVTLDCVPSLMAQLPIPKLRQLGGKFGEEIMTALGISTVGRLQYYICDLWL